MGSGPEVVQYEYYNFYRWVKYADIVKKWNAKHAEAPIKNIVAIDADLMFLVNPHKFYFRVLHSLGYTSAADFDVATVAPGALQIYSASGLIEYGHYILAWYGRPYEQILAQTHRIASPYMGRLHFSDKQIGVFFAHKDEERRSLCFQHDPALDRVVQMNRIETPRCMIEALECVPTNSYNLIEEDIDTMTINNRMVHVGRGEKLPQCFIVSRGRLCVICVRGRTLGYFDAFSNLTLLFLPHFILIPAFPGRQGEKDDEGVRPLLAVRAGAHA
jgi:hypothetical protein